MSLCLCDLAGAQYPTSLVSEPVGSQLPSTPPPPPPQSPTKSGEDARGAYSAALPQTRDGEQRDGQKTDIRSADVMLFFE